MVKFWSAKLDAHMEKLQESIRLPEQFCGTCTLKEGTVVVIIILQTISALAVAFLLSTLFLFPEAADSWWYDKFREDYDPYLNNEYKTEIIDRYYHYWRPVSMALAVIEGTYFLTGFGVIYSLWRKDINPSCYLPWLVFTGLLISCNFLTVLGMFIMTCIISAFRVITVTWDIVPMILCTIYGCMWSYGFMVVLAHYKRRKIVKFWSDYKKKESQGHWSNDGNLKY